MMNTPNAITHGKLLKFHSTFSFVVSAATAAFAIITMFLASPAARAIDGGVGRSMSGAQIAPFQAVVPPDPGGVYMSLGEVYYHGDFGGTKQLPRAGQIVGDMSDDISLTTITAAYVWPYDESRWNFLSAIVLPLAWERIRADVTMPDGSTRRVSDTVTNIYDIMVRAIQACYHIDKTSHISLTFDIWLPTGNYDPNALANPGLDNWTYIPSVSYTKLFAKGQEISALWALEYYSWNRSTDYKNGTLSRVEVLALQPFGGALKAGLIGSWMQQIQDDSGPLAEVFGGFRGRVFGIGPVITYTIKTKKADISLNARCVFEFNHKNMPQGNVFAFNAGMRF